MKQPAQVQSGQSSSAVAAPRPEAATGIAIGGAVGVAQAKLAQAIGQSAKTASQQAVGARVNHGPRMAVQRKQMAKLNPESDGDEAQEREAPVASEGLSLAPLQRQQAASGGVMQLSVAGALRDAGWGEASQVNFYDVCRILNAYGFEEEDKEAVLSGISAAEFDIIYAGLGSATTGLLIKVNLPWDEIRGYMRRLGAVGIQNACDEYLHGTRDRAHLSNEEWLKDELRTTTDTAIQAGVAAFNVNTVQGQLAARFGTSTFVVQGELININGMLSLHPKKIDELPAEDLNALVEATRQMGDAGVRDKSGPQAVLKRFGSSGSHRMRYANNAVEAGTFVRALVPAPKQAAFDVLWAAASEKDKFRAYDLRNNYSTAIKGAASLNGKCAGYAMGMAPASIPDFVNHFEFYHAYFMEQAREIGERYNVMAQQMLEAGEMINADGGTVPITNINKALEAAAKWMFGKDSPTGKTAPYAYLDKNSPGTRNVKESYEEYQTALAAHQGVGMYQLDATPCSPQTRRDQLKANADQLKFSSDSSAAYHVLKHHKELSDDEKQGDTVDDKVNEFLTSARTTVENGEWTHKAGNMGGGSHVFKRAPMRAIVVVTETANAFFATYMSG